MRNGYISHIQPYRTAAMRLVLIVTGAIIVSCSGGHGRWKAFHSRINGAYDGIEQAITMVQNGNAFPGALGTAERELRETIYWREESTLGEVMDFAYEIPQYRTWKQDTTRLFKQRIARIDALLERSPRVKLGCGTLAFIRFGGDVESYVDSLQLTGPAVVTVTAYGRSGRYWTGESSIYAACGQ